VSRERFIAVIDDDEPFRTAVVELLGGMAFGARGFASADEFVATDSADSYDCIITDIQMPGMSGIELLRFLRSRDLHTPVILVTAHLNRPKLDLESFGETCLLTKPFDSDILAACLQKALDEPRCE
jgi:FixJ family two-component response regulator